MSYITYPAIFNGTDLATITGLTVLATNAYNPAKRDVKMGDLALTDKSTVRTAHYAKKIIVVRVGIARATRDLAEQSFDSLMRILQGVEKELWIKQSGDYRKYTCTYLDTVFRVEGGAYLEMDLFFGTSDHFGYDVAPTLLLQVTNFTSGSKTDILDIGGSAPWQAPTITITYSAVSGGTNATVAVGNGGTGQRLTITSTWVAGDVLEIDALARTVKVNGALVDADGAIPQWAPGVGYLTYSDTFTARTFSNTMRYYKRYV